MEKREENEKVIVDRRSGGAFKKYVVWGVMAFLVLAAAIVLIFLFVQKEDFSDILSKLGSALSPVLVGGIMAYVMNPLMSFFDRKISHFLLKRVRKKRRALSVSRVVSLILTLVLVVVIIGVLVYMLVPEITSTFDKLADEVPGQANNFLDWFRGTVGDGSWIGNMLATGVEKITKWIEDFIDNGLFTFAGGLLESVYSGVVSAFGIIYNILIGLVFSIYILLSKERFTASIKKLIYSVFKRKRANRIVRTARDCHRKFTGAITGKVLDSVIVGVICFVGMTLFNFPYVALISVIVGVTNLIPFFGPYIGAVPSALLILFVDPLQCLWFVIFIIVLQQIDCNILDPRIVGDSIGLSAFWVLFACVVFGSLFGIWGLLLGVPATACLQMIFGEIMDNRLHKKGLPTDTDEYMAIDNVDETEMIVINTGSVVEDLGVNVAPLKKKDSDDDEDDGDGEDAGDEEDAGDKGDDEDDSKNKKKG
ncbi:MAG: AI-2E family transporter [Lachnospiraceae bacterium]|nr:AI-2E family transporter [Lachnospiraceae bacterium]